MSPFSSSLPLFSPTPLFPQTDHIYAHRHHLKTALSLMTYTQDNHLRALLLALISAHYMHTASEHAQGMLRTCETLAAGLGAGARGKKKKKGGEGEDGEEVGNAWLRLWVGERFLGMFFFPFLCSLIVYGRTLILILPPFLLVPVLSGIQKHRAL